MQTENAEACMSHNVLFVATEICGVDIFACFRTDRFRDMDSNKYSAIFNGSTKQLFCEVLGFHLEFRKGLVVENYGHIAPMKKADG